MVTDSLPRDAARIVEQFEKLELDRVVAKRGSAPYKSANVWEIGVSATAMKYLRSRSSTPLSITRPMGRPSTSSRLRVPNAALLVAVPAEVDVIRRIR